MEQSRHIHPLILAAAVSVMLFSAVGSAALLGWLPSSHGVDTTSTPPTPAPAQVALPTSEPTAQPKPVAHKAAAVKVVQPVREAPARLARKTVCHDCGAIESIREVTEAGEGSGLGAVIGGVTGGVVGRQFGGGRGKDVMTVVGVVGGGVAGHQIEKRVRATRHYEITVRFDDGSSRVYRQENANWQIGERIRLVDGQLTHGA